MPCSCDGYKDDDLDKAYDANNRLRMELCRARAIIHKMLQTDPDLGAELRKKADHEVRLLLEHKRGEVKHDAENLRTAQRELQKRVKTIQKLGGEPAKVLLSEIEEFDRKIAALEAMTDAQLLG